MTTDKQTGRAEVKSQPPISPQCWGQGQSQVCSPVPAERGNGQDLLDPFSATVNFSSVHERESLMTADESYSPS